jgi:hypothetical protein
VLRFGIVLCRSGSGSDYADPEVDPTIRSRSGSDYADPEADTIFKFDADPELSPSYEIKNKTNLAFIHSSASLLCFI